jgi:hypothetical protein
MGRVVQGSRQQRFEARLLKVMIDDPPYFPGWPLT